MLASTVMCATALGIALAGPARMNSAATLAPGAESANTWSAVGADVAERLRPPPLFTSVGVYHARTRPLAEARFWLAQASDLWLTVNHPACHELVATGRDPWLTDLSAILVRPVSGDESSPFGYRWHPILKRRKLHKGLDFRGKRGTPVMAAGPGRVVFAGRMGSYGNVVMIEHGLGLETRYAHLQRIRTKLDRVVMAGEQIGTVGSTGRSTGPHLHFEVRQFGEPLDPKWALHLEQPSFGDRVRTLWHIVSTFSTRVLATG